MCSTSVSVYAVKCRNVTLTLHSLRITHTMNITYAGTYISAHAVCTIVHDAHV